MPELGEIKRGRDLGYTGESHKYIWYACPDCGEERWKALRGGKVVYPKCLKCGMEALTRIQKAGLREDYRIAKLTIKQLAQKYGVCTKTITKQLRLANILERTLSEINKQRFKKLDLPAIKRDYCKLNMNISQVARKYDTSADVIKRRLKAMGIPIRTIGEIQKGRLLKPNILTEDLQHDYCDLKISIVEIGKKYSIDNSTVSQRLKAVGIQMRPNGNRLRHLNAKDLQYDYCKLKMTATDIGKKHNVGHKVITRRLCSMGITIRTSGEIIRTKWNRMTSEEKSVWIKKRLAASRIKPSKPEIVMDNLLQSLYPDEWKYVGDGDVILGGLNPDFINVNGQKAIIELFGDWWHSKAITGRWRWQEVWLKKRHYTKYGFKTLIIWERELKDIDKVANKVERFCHKLEGG